MSISPEIFALISELKAATEAKDEKRAMEAVGMIVGRVVTDINRIANALERGES
jgi:hypothetical protein